MENRQPSKELEELAFSLINADKRLAEIRNSSVKIAYLVSDREKRSSGKTIYGQCERIQDKYKWSVPYDFMITFYAPNVERFTDKQKEILMLHELMHVGIEKDGNEETYYVNKHDIEDFKTILEEYGLDWANG